MLNAIDLRFDPRRVEMLDGVACRDVILWASARAGSPEPRQVHRALEFLIADTATILATNYVIHNGDVRVRREPL